jgi:hypothetical protein
MPDTITLPAPRCRAVCRQTAKSPNRRGFNRRRHRSQVGCHGRRIIGCPHEEGIDYEGATCPACPFWAGRDRWTGKRLH